jgi:hypothetical protein
MLSTRQPSGSQTDPVAPAARSLSAWQYMMRPITEIDPAFLKTFGLRHLLVNDVKILKYVKSPENPNVELRKWNAPSLKQIAMWGATGVAVGGVVALNWQMDYITTTFLFQDNALLAAVYGWDPLFTIMTTVFSKFPKASPLDLPQEMIQQEQQAKLESDKSVRALSPTSYLPPILIEEFQDEYLRAKAEDREGHLENPAGVVWHLSPTNMSSTKIKSGNFFPASPARSPQLHPEHSHLEMEKSSLPPSPHFTHEEKSAASQSASDKSHPVRFHEAEISHHHISIHENADAVLEQQEEEAKEESHAFRIQISRALQEYKEDAALSSSSPIALEDMPEEYLSDAIKAERAINSKVAVIIPCHYSLLNVEATLAAAMRHVAPEQIFVVDNGNQDTPLDNLQDLVKAIHPRITYIWCHVGNKNLGEYVGAELAEDKGLIYSLTIDDDTQVPATIRLKHATDKISLDDAKGTVKAVSYPLFAISAAEHADNENWLVRCQQIEYLLAATTKLAQESLGGVLYPHGGGCMWETKTLRKVLEIHTLNFYSEDTQKGFRTSDLGYKTAFCAEVPFKTKSPASLFGAFPNYYQQQVRSWVMSPPTLLPEYLKSLVYHNDYHWWALPFIKLYQFNNIYAVLNIPASICLMSVKGGDWRYWAYSLPWLALAAVGPMILKYRLEHNDRKDLSYSWGDCFKMIPYKIIGNVNVALGLCRSLFVYLPTRNHILTVDEIHASLSSDRQKLQDDCEKQPASLLTYKKIYLQKLEAAEKAKLAQAPESAPATATAAAVFFQPAEKASELTLSATEPAALNTTTPFNLATTRRLNSSFFSATSNADEPQLRSLSQVNEPAMTNMAQITNDKTLITLVNPAITDQKRRRLISV